MSQEAKEWNYADFEAGKTPLPRPNMAWNTYGKGIDSVGVDGKPEEIEIPSPSAEQLLIRIDAVGLCFSDVKLVKQGGSHPKLYGRDLRSEPTRLGHEVSVTVIEVGDDLASRFKPGQRLAIQPDIHIDGRSTAYGYTIPGGLVQYHLIGSEVLDGDDGAYVLPVDPELGYAAAALSEPWACVEASYTQRRRLSPLKGGTMLIVGSTSDASTYAFSTGLNAPSTIVLNGVSNQVAELVNSSVSDDCKVVVIDQTSPAQIAAIATEYTGEAGFDDIITLGVTSGEVIEELAKVIGFRGTMAMAGTEPLDRYPEIDVGRIHYHYTAFLGTSTGDVSDAYGEARNRADLVPGGTTVFVGAAGPMGQMHIQRALEKSDGPDVLIGIDLDDDRIEVAKALLGPLAAERSKKLVFVNPTTGTKTTQELVDAHADGVVDDVVVTVPSGPVMAEASELMGPDGMLVLFAGVANGTMAPLNMSNVFLHNAQFTGTSGSSIEDQAAVLDKAQNGSLSPERAVAAVGGIDAGKDGIRALLEGHYAGKVIIFPQLSGLKITSLADLADGNEEMKAALGEHTLWNEKAERLLFEKYHA